MNKIYNNGFLRRETNQILQIERSKLNRLLDQERRLRLALVETAGKQLADNPDFPADREQIWRRIQSHSQIQTLQNQISVLTDTYPQFLNQANAARAKSEQEAHREFDAANRRKPKPTNGLMNSPASSANPPLSLKKFARQIKSKAQRKSRQFLAGS